MRVRKAVITAAGAAQRRLPLQNLIDRDGRERSVLAILVEEAVRAKIEEIAVVVSPGDEEAYSKAVTEHAGRITFLRQDAPRGYGHAVWCARDFTAGEAFLHLVGDHVFVGAQPGACAARLVEIAAVEKCSVSAVQPTHESLLLHYGVIGGQRMQGAHGVYRVESVVEKPSPTQAEQTLIVPGLRAGYYLCFFGMHVLSPTVMDLLHQALHDGSKEKISLSAALDVLAAKERYLAAEMRARRYDIGVHYGLLTAQLALALNGKDRDEVLTTLVRLLAVAPGAEPSHE